MSNINTDATTIGVVEVDRKIDLFFRLHILPMFEPEKLNWWFSLSGGKDSFSMAQGIRNWYYRAGVRFCGTGFVIDQWGGPATRSIEQQITWDKTKVVDGEKLTRERTGYRHGQQAPCRACSDVRRDLTDHLLEDAAPLHGQLNIVARGLHLSDTAISLLWRHAVGRSPAYDMIQQRKALPLALLPSGSYLAKPLTYVREFESSRYADHHGFKPSCCGCPACQFPSRRDIVEETLRDFYDDPLWEFDVPGLSHLLNHFGAPNVHTISAGGVLPKHRHLPRGFSSFMVDKFRRIATRASISWPEVCDMSLDLDQIGTAFLRQQPGILFSPDRVPAPALVHDRELTQLEEAMIATMGPFWGLIGLDPSLAATARRLQEQVFGFHTDDRWGQVNSPLNDFYRHNPAPTTEHIVKITRKQHLNNG